MRGRSREAEGSREETRREEKGWLTDGPSEKGVTGGLAG